MATFYFRASAMVCTANVDKRICLYHHNAYNLRADLINNSNSEQNSLNMHGAAKITIYSSRHVN